MNYLLDTNICIYIINKRPAAVLKRVQSKQPGQIAISTITLAELEYGVAQRYPDRNRISLLEFLEQGCDRFHRCNRRSDEKASMPGDGTKMSSLSIAADLREGSLSGPMDCIGRLAQTKSDNA